MACLLILSPSSPFVSYCRKQFQKKKKYVMNKTCKNSIIFGTANNCPLAPGESLDSCIMDYIY